MDQVMAMLNTMNNNINESKKESNDKFESLKTDNIINNQSINEKFNELNNTNQAISEKLESDRKSVV